MFDYLNHRRAYDLVLEDYMGENAMEILRHMLKWEKMTIEDKFEDYRDFWDFGNRHSYLLLGNSNGAIHRVYLNDVEDFMLSHGFVVTK